jgi:hypothetical protein
MSAEALPLRPGGAKHRAAHGRRRRAVDPVGDPAGDRVVRRIAYRIIAAALLAAVPLVYLQEQRGRDFEAWLASHLFAFLGQRTGYYGGSLSMAWFSVSDQLRVGLIVTSECTIALLIIPFLIATAGLIWQQLTLVRPLIGLCAAVLMLFAMNQIRLLQILGFVKRMGLSSGFYWGHTMVGSIITVVGLGVTLLVFAMIAVRWRDSATSARRRSAS